MNQMKKSSLSVSQRQAIIKLIEKPNKFKIGDQICFSNVDQKIVSKAIPAKLKKVLPFLISPGKTAYVDGRFIG